MSIERTTTKQMKMIEGNAEVDVRTTIKLTLSKGEAKALNALAGYGDEPFLKVFYEYLGKSYLKPYEADLRSLFEKLRTDLARDVNKLDELERSISTVIVEFKKKNAL